MKMASQQAMTDLVARINTGGKGWIRNMDTENGMQFSIWDFMWNTGTYTSKGAVSSMWTRWTDSEKRACFIPTVTYIKFPGHGQRETPCTDTRGLIRLLSLMGGRVEKAYKIESDQIVQRYIDGDLTLCNEIHDNKQMGPDKACAKFIENVESRALEMALDEDPNLAESGFVYGTASQAFPGLVKIGRTKDINHRISSGNTFCAPSPHVVIAAAPSFDYVRDERLAHTFFQNARREGEFFEVSHEAVQHFFTAEILAQYNRELMDRMQIQQI